jgi:hypothetical protein
MIDEIAPRRWHLLQPKTSQEGPGRAAWPASSKPEMLSRGEGSVASAARHFHQVFDDSHARQDFASLMKRQLYLLFSFRLFQIKHAI